MSKSKSDDGDETVAVVRRSSGPRAWEKQYEGVAWGELSDTAFAMKRSQVFGHTRRDGRNDELVTAAERATVEAKRLTARVERDADGK